MSRLRSAALAVAGVALAASLVGCTPSGPGVDAISGATFTQYQAVPDFDNTEYTQDDPAEIQKLKDLLDDYDIDPAGYQSRGEPCPGALSTNVTLTYTDSNLATQFSLGGCDTDGFDTAATDLFAEWRRDLGSVK